MNSFYKLWRTLLLTLLFSSPMYSQPVFDPGFGGYVSTINGQPIKDVTIKFYVNGQHASTFSTTSGGSYVTFFYMQPSDIYSFIPNKTQVGDREKYEGISTFDVARIQKHILDILPFDSPLQYIAADINGDKEIDAVDMMLLRRFILRQTPNLPLGVWRFIDKAYKFKNLDNSLKDNVPDSIVQSGLEGNRFFSFDFTAIKYGDVNNTFIAGWYHPIITRSNESLVLPCWSFFRYSHSLLYFSE